MSDRVILLVEDNPDDEALTIRALQRNNIMNEVVVARDGVEAMDYLLAAGAHKGRDVTDLPQVVLLDLKLPKMDGLKVLRRIRADTRTIAPSASGCRTSENSGESSSQKASRVSRHPLSLETSHSNQVIVLVWC